ncbi:helix-turn-helix domain-containing protein [Kiloniella sp. b19]|uniref:helix-turn-helix domain-containing protein n=1 Tax=Kiloniella sp. GXU_MW_B19 TaxID=3141326 RepID=UPI0031CE62D5
MTFGIEINEVVFNRLELVRKNQRSTQNDVLEQAGLSVSAWNRYGRSKQDLPFRKILNLCEVLKFDPASLIVEIQIGNQHD